MKMIILFVIGVLEVIFGIVIAEKWQESQKKKNKWYRKCFRRKPRPWYIRILRARRA